jgi:hypothetical protein
MVPLPGLLNMVQDAARRFGLSCQDRILTLSPVYHDMALFDLMSAALHGTTLVFPDPDRLKDPGHWAERIQQCRVTAWNTVPATMTMLLDYLEGSSEADKELSSLRYAFLGGDWIPLGVFHRLKRFAPAATMVSVGGPTEISVWNLLYPVESLDPRWRSIPYGYPIRNAAYHLLDDRLEDCPAMVVGEMYCSGTGLAAGYLNDAEKTGKAFLTHSDKKLRMFRTGDLGRLHPDGYIEFIGRRDNQVNVNGYRIELGEIETAMGRHPSVSRAVAVVAAGSMDDSRGGLALWIVPKRGAQCLIQELRTFLKRHVPKYMLPSGIGLVEQFPLLRNNKVDRRAMSQWPMPRQAGRGFGGPARHHGRACAGAGMVRAAGIEAGEPGPELFRDRRRLHRGGPALQHDHRREVFGLSVASIFSHPTIRDLAAAIEAAPKVEHGREHDAARIGVVTPEAEAGPAAGAWPPAAPAPLRLPLAPATRVQQRMFYEERRQRNNCYNLCLQVGLSVPDGRQLAPERIEAAFNAVVARHEILRTNFQEVPDAGNADLRCVMQRISPARRIKLERRQRAADSGSPEFLSAFRREFTERPYDLENGTLLRLALVEESPSLGTCSSAFITSLWTAGRWHFSCGIWRWPLTVKNFASGAPAGRSRPVGKLASVSGGRQGLASPCRPPDPRGRIPSAILDALSLNDACPDAREGERHAEERIPQHVMDGVVRLGERCGATPFAVMCAVFGLLVAEYNRSDTAQFGTYVAARAHPGLEAVFGSMTAPAPLIMRFDRSRPLAEAVRDAMRQLSESMDLSLIPFEDLVQAVAPARRGDGPPLFGMALTFDNTPAQPIEADGMELRPQAWCNTPPVLTLRRPSPWMLTAHAC